MLEKFFVSYKKNGLPAQAFLVVGNPEASFHKIREVLSGVCGLKNLDSSPDYFFKLCHSLSVDDSREFKEKEGTKSFSGENRFFVIGANSFTREAQNALLKVLEEPKANHYIFILSNATTNLLPTLLSRLMVIKNNDEVVYDIKVAELAKKFLSSEIPERIKIAEKMLGPKNQDDTEKQILNKKLIEFVSVLEQAVYNSGSKEFSKLAKISKARDYLLANAGAPRLVLEFLALSC